MSISSTDETMLEDSKDSSSATHGPRRENSGSIFGPEGQARKQALRSKIIKVTIGVYVAILLLLLYEFFK